MPALDTNVLVRLLVADDSRQLARARAVIRAHAERDEPLFVPLTVTLELEWVLRARYGFDRSTILTTLAGLLETRELDFQDEASVEVALYFYRSTKADFGECVHLACSITHEQTPLLTFDRHAARLNGAELFR